MDKESKYAIVIAKTIHTLVHTCTVCITVSTCMRYIKPVRGFPDLRGLLLFSHVSNSTRVRLASYVADAYLIFTRVTT